MTNNKPSIHEIQSALAYFTGSEIFYKHNFIGQCRYTEGVQYIAENCGAYWLLDDIMIETYHLGLFQKSPFLCWNLKVDLEKSTAILTASDGNEKVLYQKDLTYTDFPLAEIRFFFTDNVLMLPSEY